MWVYVLYSSSLDQFYRGMTDDLRRRMLQHNRREEKATAPGVPWEVVWATRKASRSEAYRLERKLKNLSRARLIELMLKYSESVQGPDELLLLQQLSGC